MKILYRIQKIISYIEANGEFTISDAKETLRSFGQSMEQCYRQKISILLEYNANNWKSENISRLLNQLEISHNFSQILAEEYVNCDISTSTTE